MNNTSVNNIIAIIFAILSLAVATMAGVGLYKEFYNVRAEYSLIIMLSFVTSLFGGLSLVAIIGQIRLLINSFEKSSNSPFQNNIHHNNRIKEDKEKKATFYFGGKTYNSLNNKTLLTSGNASIMYALWFLVGFFVFVCLLIGMFVFRDFMSGKNVPTLLCALPITILILVFFALKATIRWNKFGQSTLEFEGEDLSLKNQYEFVLKTTKDVIGGLDMLVELKATEVATKGYGKNRTTTSKTIAYMDKKIEINRLNLKYGVTFSLIMPDSLDKIGGDYDTSKTTWVLKVQVSTSGVDYQADFIMPFKESL